MARIVCCARCGRTRNHHSRGLCAPCSTTVYRRRNLDDYDLQIRPLESVAADYEVLCGRGLTMDQIAAELGYAHADSLRNAMCDAIRRGLLPDRYRGGLWAGARWRGRPLRPQERRILALAAAGVVDFAGELGIARSTVAAYRHRIRAKLGVTSWAEAVCAYAAEAVIAA